MKNHIFRKIILLLLFPIEISIITVSCGSDFIQDVQNKGAFDSDTYFQNEQQVFTVVVATYDGLKKYAGGFENMVTFFNAASDDFYSGGGSSTDGIGIQGISNYTINPSTMPASYWKDFYQSIASANLVIKNAPNAKMDEQVKKRFIAEAKVLRALYYFELLRIFKNIPFITEPINTTDDYYNIPQADPKKIYTQIEADILSAIPDLPITVSGIDRGRIFQGNARAILGKIYLYDNKKTEAAQQFAEVNGTPGQTSQYGYKLVSDYNSLWLVDNKFTTESVLEVMHTNIGNSDWSFWGQGNDEGNSICIMISPRSYAITKDKPNNDAPDVVSGWAFNPVTANLFNFMQGDPRINATILNVKQLQTDGKANYSPANLDTGYFLNKYLPTTDEVSDKPGAKELNFRQNYIAIRLADTYLMEAEALEGTGARAQALLDAVRARVGLPSIPVSMQAIKNERRKELAGEGHRWFDLVRWGDASSVLSSKGFTVGKNEILPIPINELINTILKQNPNYN